MLGAQAKKRPRSGSVGFPPAMEWSYIRPPGMPRMMPAPPGVEMPLEPKKTRVAAPEFRVRPPLKLNSPAATALLPHLSVKVSDSTKVLGGGGGWMCG
jgi:hypothetical protein